MRLILSMLMLVWLAVPAAAEEQWASIAVAQWTENRGDEIVERVRAIALGYSPTKKDAEDAVLAYCSENAPNCEVYTSWNKGCVFVSGAYLGGEKRATIFKATSEKKAYAACRRAGGDCKPKEVTGGCIK